MLRRSVEARVLSSVTAEARRSSAPSRGSDQLEARLLARIAEDTGPALVNEPRVSRWALSLASAAALAVLAVLALLALRLEQPPPVASEHRDATPVVKVDGDQLAPERVIVTNEQPLTVVHAGRAQWRLDPRSAASVVEKLDGIHVRLTRGALLARVVPASEPDRFVVDVGDTRISVHGTVFRVELRGEQSHVRVEEGVVAVGPRQRPSGPMQLLRAPAEGTFNLDGSSVAEAPRAPRRRHAAASRTASAAASPSPSAASSAEPAAAVAKQLTIGQVEAGVSVVVRTLSECFEQNTSSSGDVRISARTSVTLDISPAGRLAATRFSPPLAPAVQACSERALEAVEFAASEAGARVTRVLEFAR